jgi:hypothetical protein
VSPKAGRFSGEVGLLNCGLETARVIAVTDSHLPCSRRWISYPEMRTAIEATARSLPVQL